MEDNNLRLTNIFKDAGANFNYKNVTAEFEAFTEVKVRWQRSYEWADFKVSDYLADAPDNILSALANTLFSRISGQSEGDLTTEFKDYVSSMDFTNAHRDVYLGRIDAHITDKFDEQLQAIAKREGFKAEGIVVAINEIADRPHCSVLMRTLVVPPVFETAPDYVLDFVFTHYLVIFDGGYNPGEDITLRAVLKDDEHPDEVKARAWLGKNNIFF